MFRLDKARQLLLTLALTSLVGVGPAGADFYPISTPDPGYTSRTSLIPIPTSTPDQWGTVTEVTDGRLAVRSHKFGNEWSFLGGSLGLGPGTWSSGWGTPPLVESASTQSLGIFRAEYEGDFVLTFSSPIKTFGFEARPGIGEFAPRDQLVRVDFYKGGPLDLWQIGGPTSMGAPFEYVGSIERRVYEAEGALLFAASTTTEYFTQARVFFRDAGAIARLRYSVGEQPAPTNADFFTIRNGVRTDQVTMNVGEILPLTYLVKFRNTGQFLDVTNNQNTRFFTDPPLGSLYFGFNWLMTEQTRNKIFTLYARYRDPFTGQSITDTIRVYVRP